VLLKEIISDKCQVCKLEEFAEVHKKDGASGAYHPFVPVRVATEESVIAERKELAEKLKYAIDGLASHEAYEHKSKGITQWIPSQPLITLQEVVRRLEKEGE
jgi:hypothetical protein